MVSVLIYSFTLFKVFWFKLLSYVIKKIISYLFTGLLSISTGHSPLFGFCARNFLLVAHCRNVRGLGRVSYID